MSETKPSETKPSYFGTDGIRGTFGVPPLDEITVRRLGLALARYLRAENLRAENSQRRFVIGGDTRNSSPILGRWLREGLEAEGFEPTDLGTVPTPAVAERTRALNAACGIAISASHNPHPDNGIKLIDREGFKWSPEAEYRLEQGLENIREQDLGETPTATGIPPAIDRQATQAYLQGLRDSLTQTNSNSPLTGLSIALDTGNGAASAYARALFEDLGAKVDLVHDTPNGHNINADCGSTYPQVLSQLVRERGSDLGFSFDGDADRVIVADEQGEVRDGDAVLYLWASDLASRGQLPGHRIVATSMSNLGLERALQRRNIEVVRCGVGDREVVAAMRNEGIVLGGEQSGHIVNLAHSTTGDGLLTALQVAEIRRRSGEPLSRLLADFERFPQLIQNVRVRHKPAFEGLPKILQARDQVEAQLGNHGRLVLRYSGTEPLARIMIEGPDRVTIETMANTLAQVIADELS